MSHTLYFLLILFQLLIGYIIGKAIARFGQSKRRSESEAGAVVQQLFVYEIAGVIALALVADYFIGSQWTIIGVASNNGIPEPVVLIIGELPVLLAMVAGVAGAVFSVWPTIRRSTGNPVTSKQLSIRYGLLIVAGFVIGELGSQMMSDIELRATVLVAFGSPLIAGLVLYLALPRIWVLGQEPREPKQEERNRIEKACDRIGIELDEVIVFEVDKLYGAVWILGRPGVRSLVIYESFLKEATDDDLAVALAEAEGRYRHRVMEYEGIAILVLVLYLVSGFLALGIGPSSSVTVDLALLAFPIVIFVFSGLQVWAQKQTYRVDEMVGEQFGVETVLTAYDRHGDILFNSRMPNRIEFIQLVPSAQSRIERLRDRFEIE